MATQMARMSLQQLKALHPTFNAQTFPLPLRVLKEEQIISISYGANIEWPK